MIDWRALTAADEISAGAITLVPALSTGQRSLRETGVIICIAAPNNFLPLPADLFHSLRLSRVMVSALSLHRLAMVCRRVCAAWGRGRISQCITLAVVEDR